MAKEAFETQQMMKNNCEEMQTHMKSLHSDIRELKEKEQLKKREKKAAAAAEQEKKNTTVQPVRSHTAPKMDDYEKQSSKRHKPNNVKATTNNVPKQQNGDVVKDVDYCAEDAKKQADALKEKGNNAVKRQEYDLAIQFYESAIEIYKTEPVYYSNLALCYLKKERYAECIEQCNKAIKLNPKMTKGFYRRMQAYEMLGEWSKALRDIEKVICLEPTVMAHQRDLERLRERNERENIERRKMRLLEKKVWQPLEKNQKYTDFIMKGAQYRSKRPLKRIKVEEVPAHDVESEHVTVDDGEKIPDAVLDKLFNNNTGEYTAAEPLPSRHPFDFSGIFNRAKNSAANKIAASLGAAASTSASATAADKAKKSDDDDDDDDGDGDENLPPPPTSGVQFYKTWKELTASRRYAYLKNLRDEPLNKLLGASLDSELLSDILRVLNNSFIRNKIPVDSILREIGNNPETSILSMFLSNEDKENLKNLMNYMESSGVDIAEIKARFDM